MSKIDFASYDLTRPRDRRAVLNSISPDREDPRKYHEELLQIFRKEMAFRCGSEPDEAVYRDKADYFESIYQCALLLYMVGDPADAPLMWEAKHLNMDLGCCFDLQFLMGGGLLETIEYLEAHGHLDIANRLRGEISDGDFEDIVEWEQYRIDYHYPDRGTSKTAKGLSERK